MWTGAKLTALTSYESHFRSSYYIFRWLGIVWDGIWRIIHLRTIVQKMLTATNSPQIENYPENRLSRTVLGGPNFIKSFHRKHTHCFVCPVGAVPWKAGWPNLEASNQSLGSHTLELCNTKCICMVGVFCSYFGVGIGMCCDESEELISNVSRRNTFTGSADMEDRAMPSLSFKKLTSSSLYYIRENGTICLLSVTVAHSDISS